MLILQKQAKLPVSRREPVQAATPPRRVGPWLTAILISLTMAFALSVQGAETTLVSVNDAGTASGNAVSGVHMPKVSADGRYVAFTSYASDLVPAGLDTNNKYDVFVRDLVAGTTTLVSVNDAGTASSNGESYDPVLSADGRYVAFVSYASDLVPAGVDTNSNRDAFLRDLVAGTTTLVSVNNAGTASGNGWSIPRALSADGRFVNFGSSASDLVPAGLDTNNTFDVFLRDLEAGTTTLVSVNDAGTASGNSNSYSLFGADERFVTFTSSASDLVPAGVDTNGNSDVFVRDLVAGTTTLVSVNDAGTASGNNGCAASVLSADGRYVIFGSYASDLVPAGLDTYLTNDVFVRDLVAGTTTLVSVNDAGTVSGDSSSANPVLSADGRYVAFISSASDLVPAGVDTNSSGDTFVRDLVAGTTTLVSVNDAGAASGNGQSDQAVLMSADGRFVAFVGYASDLVPAGVDTNGNSDVFVRDLVAGTTTLVSVNDAGTASGDSLSRYPALSADGRFVAFASAASDLVPFGVDANGTLDIFARSLLSTATPAGEDIVVQPPLVDEDGNPLEDAPDISFTFEDIENGGDTTVVVTEPGPGTSSAPSGFRITGLTGGPILFDINTTATLAPGSTFEVCFDYSGLKVAGSGATLTLTHEVDGVWIDITTANDTVNKIICGVADSFSYFAILESIEVLGPTDPAAIGTVIAVGIDIGDPDLTDTVRWHWGDGSSSDVAATLSAVTGEHIYTAAGVYTVTATLLVGDVEAGSADFQYVVVYDPSAGFVTGGGWFTSPEGAYVAVPALSGKATFGFASKYKTGAFVPTGTTEFQFKAGDLNFRSTAYEWLVIAGARAQFKGTGTVNGLGNYGFMLTAVDEVLTPSTDVDLFRIKLWDKDAADAVVYDNGLGIADDGDPTTAIEGGSIVIQKAKRK